MKRVLIVEDHPVAAKGLELALSDEFTVAACIADGGQVVPWLQENEADLVLLDLSLPNRSGLEILADLRLHGVASKVLVVTTHEDPFLRRTVREYGAGGFVEKSACVSTLQAAVGEVGSGGRWFPEPAPSAPIRYRSRLKPTLQLTKRQLDVLRELLVDSCRKEIGSKLGISTNTVDEYLAALRNLFGVRSNPALVRASIEHGFLSPLRGQGGGTLAAGSTAPRK